MGDPDPSLWWEVGRVGMTGREFNSSRFFQGCWLRLDEGFWGRGGPPVALM